MNIVCRGAVTFGLVIAMVVGGLAQPAHADVNDFTIVSFDSQMTLGRDGDGRSTLKITEIITADFPDFDQNHGLERAIPKKYDGHTTNVEVQSVVDKHGTAREYSTYSDSNGNLVVRMADMGVYVHGQQTYVLTYTQHDVTKSFAEADADEFYWDVNGTEWKVPFDRVSVRLMLDESLVSALRGSSSCYSGVGGSVDTCQLTHDGMVFSSHVSNLGVGGNMTIAVGFLPGTFAAYERTLGEELMILWAIIQGISTVVLIPVIIWVSVAYYRWKYRSRELKPVPLEYIPPRDTSVTMSTLLVMAQQRAGTAQLLELAVRHLIVIREIRAKSTLRAAQYEIEIIGDLSTQPPEAIELISDMFGGTLPAKGATIQLKKLRNNQAFARRTQDNAKKFSETLTTHGMFVPDATIKRRYRRWALVIGVLAIVSLSIPFGVLAVVLFGLSFANKRLSDDGLNLRRYLLGLKQYITVAEADRLRFSQSPEAVSALADFDADGSTGRAKTLRLYERLLPYAVIFGQEKQWVKELGVQYEQQGVQPDWYVGNNGLFNAAVFSSAMSSISQSMNSYMASSYSSSSGSSGGGFSGGGGGGGGGGGV